MNSCTIHDVRHVQPPDMFLPVGFLVVLKMVRQVCLGRPHLAFAANPHTILSATPLRLHFNPINGLVTTLKTLSRGPPCNFARWAYGLSPSHPLFRFFSGSYQTDRQPRECLVGFELVLCRLQTLIRWSSRLLEMQPRLCLWRTGN